MELQGVIVRVAELHERQITAMFSLMKQNFDVAAKRHKKYKNQISGLVNSMRHNE